MKSHRLQAYFDESVSPTVFVLGGCIASEEAWAAFSKEWQEMLALAPLGPDFTRNFKFSEMLNAGSFRMENIAAFARVLEKNALCTVSLHLAFRDIENAKARISIAGPRGRISIRGPRLDWGDMNNPYLFAFSMLMTTFHESLPQINERLGGNGPIDFIFDERSEARKLLRGWEQFLAHRSPQLRERFGAQPRFENDKTFLPLQAADLVAGWTRYWLDRGKKPEAGDLFAGRALRQGKLMHLEISLDEDQIAKRLYDTVWKNTKHLWPPSYVCDVKVHFGP